jgi:hypothetical protein
VLALSEVADHPHHRARGTVVDGEVTAVPRLSRTPGAPGGGRDATGPDGPSDDFDPDDPAEALGRLGFPEDDVARLRADGVVS